MRFLRPRSISLLILLLLAVDLFYSFLQHYQSMLDGDMALIILPAEPHAQVLKDPFAINALINNEFYLGPNRFMSHWALERFYKIVPLLLQRFVSPLDSIYISTAIAKTLIQAGLIYLMSLYASGTGRIMDRRFLLAALIITPFFQTFGYNNEIGLIDASITYSFFYALGGIWFLLFFLPFFLYYFHRKPLPQNRGAALLMIPAAWVASFSGPLNAAVMLLICPMLLLYMGFRVVRDCKGKPLTFSGLISKVPPVLRYGILAGLFFAALSYYAGRYNVENIIKLMPLNERYMRLPKGFIDFFTSRPVPTITLVMAISLLAINLMRLEGARAVNRLALWFLLFSAIYILLLPLGGWRPYRPYIIKKDVVQPVLIGAFILYAILALQILHQLHGIKRVIHVLVLLYVAYPLIRLDSPHFDNNDCERTALRTIAATRGDTVLVKAPCSIMYWEPIKDPQASRFNARLLHYWHVFPEVKCYYQE